ncbi:Uncharacterised protein [Candidatus Burarchaeum australiense]|nr:Uncharacterised protein [Candidatus Burarchaeum australiense]
MGELTSEMTYERLRKVQADEREGSALSRLPEEFYSSVREMISERREKLNRNFSLADAKEFENVLKVLRDIFAMREQKMMLRAVAVASGARDGSALSPEEKTSFDKIVEVLEERKRELDELFEGRKGAAEKTDREENGAGMGAEKKGGPLSVKLLVPMPEYMGADGRKYGPFKPGEKAELPELEANLLVRRRAAEVVG